MTRTLDVAVVGGGPAGIAAAWASARAGARCALIERAPQLGGNVTGAFVHTICGLYRPAEQGDAVALHPGLPARIADALRIRDAAGAPERAGRVWVLPIGPEGFGRFAAETCARLPGLQVRTGCELTGATSSVTGVALEVGDRERVERLHAKIVVDTSGDASVAALVGADTLESPPERLQLPSFIFRMSGVDPSGFEGFARMRVAHALAGAVRGGALPSGCESVLVRPAVDGDGVYLTLNLPRPTSQPYAPLDPKCVDELTARARRDAERIADHLRRTRAAFANGRVDAWPARIGVRETRRVRGEVEIDRDWVTAGRRSDDEVALSGWPIELWTDHRRAALEYPEDVSSIPLGALRAGGHPRVGTAGRCLSATHSALGALRVIGTALATGEAVGVAAALAADRGCGLDAIAAEDVRDHIRADADRDLELPS